MTPAKPRIVLVVARGEAVRNFLYSDTLRLLAQQAEVTLLTAIHDDKFLATFGPLAARIIPLSAYPEKKSVRRLREVISVAHYRWIWTEKVKNKWELLDYETHDRDDHVIQPARIETEFAVPGMVVG